MLTRLQLMDVALPQSGLTSDFYAQARQWINVFLEEQARSFDWPFYAVTAADAAFVSGQTEYAVPSGFARPQRALYVVQNGSKGAEVPVVEPGVFEVYRAGTASGQPNVAMIRTDYTAGVPVDKLVFDAVPSSSASYYRLPYYRLPTALSTDNTDDGKIPDFKDQAFLIEAIKAWAFERQDDARYPQKMGEVEQKLRNAKTNSFNASQQTVQLSPSIFRKGRRGSGNGWMGS